MNYGFVDKSCLFKQAKLICDVLGNGTNNTAVEMILETATAETHLGKLEDRSLKAGMGLTQFDEKPFYNIRDRNIKRRDLIYKKLGVDITLVKWEDLRYNPFLALLFCRLFYKLISKEIPGTIEQRASYWKKYYNTYLGKGTIKHYLEANDYYGYDDPHTFEQALIKESLTQKV